MKLVRVDLGWTSGLPVLLVLCYWFLDVGFVILLLD